MSKQVLIICYYWPPAGGPGVQRWVKFIKYLPSFGIIPVILIPENPVYPFNDDSLIKDIDTDLKIFKVPIREPYKFASIFGKQSKRLSSGLINSNQEQSFLERLLLFVRGNFFIPDARVMWVNAAVKKAKQIINEHNIDTLITTGPPHSIHLIGEKLKKECLVNWISDFRDPWTSIGYHDKLKLLPFAKRRHLKLESLVLNAADQIVVTSYATKKEFEAKTKVPVTVITNGYDFVPDTAIDNSNKFLISHVGTLLSDRNPKILWKVLKDLVDEDDKFAECLCIDLYGKVAQPIIDTIKHFNLVDFVTYKGYVSHHDAILAQQTAQILLLIESNSNAASYIIPGKLFEYIASKTPIIAIGPKVSDIQRIINETQCGIYLNYTDEKTLKSTLKTYFENYCKRAKLISKTSNFESYSRYELTSKLSRLIN